MEKTKLFQAPTKPEAPLVSKRGGRVIHISFEVVSLMFAFTTMPCGLLV